MRALLFSAALAVLAVPAAAAPHVASAWTRPATAGGVGVGFLTLRNTGSRPVVLVGAESPLARKVEVHKSSMAGGMAMMEAAPRVAIPARGSVEFAPGGYHLMLIGLKAQVALGRRIPVVLHFEDGSKVEVGLVASLAKPPT